VKRLLLLMLVGVLSGCVNGYQQVYKPVTTASDQAALILLVKGQEPVVVESPDFAAGLHQALSKGYSLLGTSSFNGRLEPLRNAVEFGKSIGATYILVSHQYTGTVEIHSLESVPVSTTVSTTGTTNKDGKSSNYKQSTTTTTETLVPVTTTEQHFNMTAAFMAKPKEPSKFGIGFRGLDPELRKKLQRNTGVVAVVVVENSPAFNANIMEGDIITAVNDVAISSGEDAAQVMLDAKPVNGVYQFHLLRNGKIVKVPVKI
jgi:hypothetical protein